jgi:hypothetical protein
MDHSARRFTPISLYSWAQLFSDMELLTVRNCAEIVLVLFQGGELERASNPYRG